MIYFKNTNNFVIENIYAAGVFQNENPEGILSGFSDRVEAVFVNSGKLTVTCGDESYICQSGTAAFFKSGEARCIKLFKNEYTEYLAVSFTVEEGSTFEFENKITSLTVLQKQLVQSICNIISDGGEYNKILPAVFTNNSLQLLKLESTIKLLTVDIGLNENDLQPQNTRDTAIFKNALAEMKERVLEQLSLEDLANKLGISLSHLKRVFGSFSNVGVHEYFMEFKVREAIKMLKNGHSVTETALHTGFNNQNYFSAAFKRIVGISPKEYCGVKKKSTTKIPAQVSDVKKDTKVDQRKTASDMPSYLL